MTAPVLPADLRVGITTFRVGVALAIAQGAIDRMYSRMQRIESENEALREALKALGH